MHCADCKRDLTQEQIDRAGAWIANYVARCILDAGLAEQVDFQLTYKKGQARPHSIAIETFGTAKVDDQVILDLVCKHFDLRACFVLRDHFGEEFPEEIIRDIEEFLRRNRDQP